MSVLPMQATAEDNRVFKPLLLRLNVAEDKQVFDSLTADGKVAFIHDEIYGQLQELVKGRHPSVPIKPDQYPEYIANHLQGRDIKEYGVWAYYPWGLRLVHILDEQEFIEVRTNRNQLKITTEERELLQTKKIGVVGLSVGQSIAVTIAMERIAGELRLADFDSAELSNLNRIRTGLQNLNLNKSVIAAREIAEFDPYINVKIFNEGLTTDNIDEFFTGGGKLDLFIEVCDGLDIKIQSRYKARELQIPVVMDTNDRGMMDVERFDLEPGRPVLHGLADGLDPDNIKDLTNEQKIPYILKMIGADTISTRMKASMIEVQQSINTWPQLASSVTLGGALTTDVSRRILLDQYHESGRYYIDIEELIKDEKNKEHSPAIPDDYIGPPELTKSEMIKAVAHFSSPDNSHPLKEQTIKEIVQAGLLAPSGGNAQPWKFLYNDKGLFIFHDEHFSYSLLDFNNLGSYIAIGAAIENISIKASVLGYEINPQYFPVKSESRIVAYIAFKKGHPSAHNQYLDTGIGIRVTNRDQVVKETISKYVLDKIASSVSGYNGAQLHLVTDEDKMREVGKLLATTEMMRILHPRGHYDTFTNELRWTPEEVKQKADGLDINSLGGSTAELAALKVASDTNAISFLRNLHRGHAFARAVNKSVSFSSALGVITMPEYSDLNFLAGGRALERIWIEANLLGLSFQPVAQLVFMLARLNQGNGADMDDYYKKEFTKIEDVFYNLLPQLKDKQPVFIFRLSKGGTPKVRSLRRPIESSFIYNG